MDIVSIVLKKAGIERVYGVTGIPITDWLKSKLQAEAGISYYGLRNEISAAYAASVDGFLSCNYHEEDGSSIGVVPGVCITVAGPGMIHALPGVANAAVNHWPMLLISAGVKSALVGKNAFQEAPLVKIAAAIPCKFAVRIEADDFARTLVPSLEHAISLACTPPMGPCFIEIAAEYFDSSGDGGGWTLPSLESNIVTSNHPFNNNNGDLRVLDNVRTLLHAAKAPLIVFGTMAVGVKDSTTRAMNIVQYLEIPFITTPMAKGIISDYHRFCCNAARSRAIRESDLILLIGAKLDWMLRSNLTGCPKTIVSLNAREIHENYGQEEPSLYTLVRVDDPGCFGKIESILASVSVTSTSIGYGWIQHAQDKRSELDERLEKALICRYDGSCRLDYYSAMAALRSQLYWAEERSCNSVWSAGWTLVAEGAKTMDITRIVFDQKYPKSRLDAGSFATMGIGLPSILAASHMERPIIAVLGDSAFGFSLAELETLARYRIGNLLLLVINNSGISTGLGSSCSEIETGSPLLIAPTQLSPETAYELVAKGLTQSACDNDDYSVSCHRVDRLPRFLDLLQECLGTMNRSKLYFINVIIDPGSKL